jgi:hypothetical protein
MSGLAIASLYVVYASRGHARQRVDGTMRYTLRGVLTNLYKVIEREVYISPAESSSSQSPPHPIHSRKSSLQLYYSGCPASKESTNTLCGAECSGASWGPSCSSSNGYCPMLWLFFLGWFWSPALLLPVILCIAIATRESKSRGSGNREANRQKSLWSALRQCVQRNTTSCKESWIRSRQSWIWSRWM